jgi:hypothetical protein
MERRPFNRPSPPEFKIGIVRRYAVQIHKKDIAEWEQKGFVNSGGRPAIVPMPPERAWVWGVPQTVAATGIERLVGRKIDGFSSSLGTYGMGGLGLWGICLEPVEDAEYGEYLVLPIANGSRFVRANGSRLSNEIYEMLIGSLVDDVKLADRECNLILKKEGNSHLLMLCLDPPTLEDTHSHPKEYETGNIADYLIFQDRRGMLTS